MFVVLNQGLQGNPTIGERQAEARWRASGGTGAGCLEIGLVNNMPDAALRATERQFSKLLSAAATRGTRFPISSQVRRRLPQIVAVPRAFSAALQVPRVREDVLAADLSPVLP